MPNIYHLDHLIGKATPMGMTQCMVCNYSGKDICFGTPEEFHEHINMEHQKIDYTKLMMREKIETEN